MKLKNKKTGEIGTLVVDGAYKFVTNFAVEDDEMNRLGEYNSLAELNEEWEDAPEEPKGNWTIDPMNENYIDDGKYTAPDELERYEELGLKFNTEEEAELAVRKLKAWKRLRDNGFEFKRCEIIDGRIDFMILPKGDYREKVYEDLDICFGGEE